MYLRDKILFSSAELCPRPVLQEALFVADAYVRTGPMHQVSVHSEYSVAIGFCCLYVRLHDFSSHILLVQPT
jgi:hypothetical protein